MTPTTRVTPPAQAVNFGRSASGRPRSSQITEKRQLSRVAVDEVGRAALCEQFRGELLGDREDVRLHVEDGATAKGFVYNAPQTSVIRLVHRQHMVDERAQDTRHPPLESGDARCPSTLGLPDPASSWSRLSRRSETAPRPLALPI